MAFPQVEGYNVLERIGSGGFSTVYKGQKKVRLGYSLQFARYDFIYLADRRQANCCYKMCRQTLPENVLD